MKDDYADIISLKLANWLLKRYKNVELLGAYVPYLKARREADLVMIKDNKLYAYEVKSRRDNLSKLKDQIADYKTTFDFVYVVIDKKFINSSFDENVGIIVYDDDKFVLKKGAVKNTIDNVCLSMLIPNKKRNSNLTNRDIRQAVIKKLKDRYGTGFESFKREYCELNLVIGSSNIRNVI